MAAFVDLEHARRAGLQHQDEAATTPADSVTLAEETVELSHVRYRHLFDGRRTAMQMERDASRGRGYNGYVAESFMRRAAAPAPDYTGWRCRSR